MSSYSSVDTSMTFFEIALKNEQSFMIGAWTFEGRIPRRTIESS